MTKREQEWQRRRSDFNHQWLKNRLLCSMDTAENVIRGRIRGNSYLRDVLESEVAEWPTRRSDLCSLLDDFVTDMSPGSLCELSPLSDGLSDDDRTTIEAMMHTVWLARCGVDGWMSSVRGKCRNVDARFAALAGIQPIASDGEISGEFATRFLEFRDACRDLSKAIEALPSVVLVT